MSDDNISKNPTTIFMHIPKAAGSTLHGILERQYRKSGIYDIDTSRLHASIVEFKQLDNEEKLKISLLKGHIPFGLHEYLPQQSRYITMLRDPVNRVISHYNYAARRPDHYLHDTIIKKKMSLSDYVSSGVTHEMDNAQVRLLSGHDDDLPFGSCDRLMLEQAKHNLTNYFHVIGLVERFDESVLLMKEKLNWRWPPIYVSRKVRAHKASSREVSQELRENIMQYTKLDYELYNFACVLFDQSISEYSDKIYGKLERFQSINTIYGTVARTGIDMRKSIKKLVTD
jgi:hypothetical protein